MNLFRAVEDAIEQLGAAGYALGDSLRRKVEGVAALPRLPCAWNRLRMISCPGNYGGFFHVPQFVKFFGPAIFETS